MRSCACSTRCRRRSSLSRSARVMESTLSAYPALFKMLIEPAEHAVQAVDEVLLLAQPVRLARVDDELRLDVVTLQPAVELLALSDRVGLVRFTLQEQRWSADVLDEGNR